MRDPIDALENFDPGSPMDPLPPAEVRRLGERHRRRRTTGIALAAAAAVAVVATGGAVIGSDRGERSVEPAGPTPSSVPTSSAPSQAVASPIDGIDITVNMPANDTGEPVEQARGDLGLSAVNFCEIGQPLEQDRRTDSVSAAASGPEYSDARELVLYPDVESAARVLDALTDSAVDCPREESGPDSVTLHEVATTDVGDDATVVSATYEQQDGSVGRAAEILQFIRVGNALLLSSGYGEWDPQALDPVRAQYAEDVAPIVEQMCVFWARGCGAEASPDDPAPDATIPADFPLASGFPEQSEPGADYGLTGPGEDVEVLDGPAVCRRGLPVASALDRLAVRWAQPEDYRSRLLLTFVDAEAAIEWQARFLNTYRLCPEDPGSDGYVSINDVQRTQVGGESWAVVRTATFQGSPAIGLEILHVVRVGSAVLVDMTSGEGSAEGAAETLAKQTDAAARVVAAMCLFTVAGC